MFACTANPIANSGGSRNGISISGKLASGVIARIERTPKMTIGQFLSVSRSSEVWSFKPVGGRNTKAEKFDLL